MTHHMDVAGRGKRLPHLVACAIPGLCAPPLLAEPGGVTMFGVLNVGVQHQAHDGRRLTLVSADGLQTSRIGVRGQEVLADGITASFYLEGAIAPDLGTGGDWRRRATVSLSSFRAGELRLGRDATPTFWNISRFNAFATNGVGAASNLVYGFGGIAATARTVVRSDNSVGYFLPAGLGGIYGQAMVAAGEGSPGRYVGARVGYTSGGLDVAIGFSDTINAAAGDKFRVANLGGSYAVGRLKLIGLVHASKQTTRQQKNYAIGGTYTIGSGVVRVSHVKADYRNAGSDDTYTGKLVAVGYVHNLSKRTALHLTVSRIGNSQGGRFYVPGTLVVTAGASSRGAEAGVHHAF